MKPLVLFSVFLLLSALHANNVFAARFTPVNLCLANPNSDFESITLPIAIGGDYATGSVQSITTLVGDTEEPGGSQAATGEPEDVTILLDTNNDGTPEVFSTDTCTYDQGSTPPGCSTTQNITIPNVTEDTTFRGRVMLSWGPGVPPPVDSCGFDDSAGGLSGFGDTEDFLLVANVNETITITDVSAPEDNGAIIVLSLIHI